MNRVRAWIAWGLLATFAPACAAPTRLNTEGRPGTLRLGWDDGLEVWSGHEKVASAPTWGGLEARVACDPKARELADTAESQGKLGYGLGLFGATLGVGSAAALVAAAADEERSTAWLVGGVTAALSGLVFAIVSRAARTQADGRAVDAVNFYDDAVRDPRSACWVPDPATRGPSGVRPHAPGDVRHPGDVRRGEPEEEQRPPGEERPVRAPEPKEAPEEAQPRQPQPQPEDAQPEAPRSATGG